MNTYCYFKQQGCRIISHDVYKQSCPKIFVTLLQLYKELNQGSTVVGIRVRKNIIHIQVGDPTLRLMFSTSRKFVPVLRKNISYISIENRLFLQLI